MNAVQLIGRLTRDPNSATPAAAPPPAPSASPCPDPSVTGRTSRPTFVDVVSFGAQAEAVASYMRQGRRIAVVGRLEHREWTTDGGDMRSKLEVVASQVDFLDKRPSGGASDVEPAYANGAESL